MCIKASSASCPNPGFDYVYTAPARGRRCTYLTLTDSGLVALSKPPMSSGTYMHKAADMFRLAIVACVLYILIRCPGDTELNDLMCKSMWSYRERVLRPLFR